VCFDLIKFLAAVEAPALNKNKSAASFCRQVAAWIPDMFCDFYLVKNKKIQMIQQCLKQLKK
jgi:hypothetical protein